MCCVVEQDTNSHSGKFNAAWGYPCDGLVSYTVGSRILLVASCILKLEKSASLKDHLARIQTCLYTDFYKDLL